MIIERKAQVKRLSEANLLIIGDVLCQHLEYIFNLFNTQFFQIILNLVNSVYRYFK